MQSSYFYLTGPQIRGNAYENVTEETEELFQTKKILI